MKKIIASLIVFCCVNILGSLVEGDNMVYVHYANFNEKISTWSTAQGLTYFREYNNHDANPVFTNFDIDNHIKEHYYSSTIAFGQKYYHFSTGELVRHDVAYTAQTLDEYTYSENGQTKSGSLLPSPQHHGYLVTQHDVYQTGDVFEKFERNNYIIILQSHFLGNWNYQIDFQIYGRRFYYDSNNQKVYYHTRIFVDSVVVESGYQETHIPMTQYTQEYPYMDNLWEIQVFVVGFQPLDNQP